MRPQGAVPPASASLAFKRIGANEHDAVEGAPADCSRQDRACRLIAIGPFGVEPK
jgi:hypothetical protein